jgi:flagellar biosynthesis/type III secretory pathway protein FliH
LEIINKPSSHDRRHRLFAAGKAKGFEEGTECGRAEGLTEGIKEGTQSAAIGKIPGKSAFCNRQNFWQDFCARSGA